MALLHGPVKPRTNHLSARSLIIYYRMGVLIYMKLVLLSIVQGSAEDRIIGGSEVVPHSIPYQASLQIRSVHYCSGTLINPRWILSAAHCVKPPYLITVVLGEHSLSRSDGNEQFYNVVRLTMFPFYQPATFRHDIMLLKMDRPAAQNAYISPITIPATDKIVPENTLCTVSGWGVTTVYSYSLSDVLMAVKVPIIPRYKCNQPSSYGGRVHVFMLCAGYRTGGKDSCQGDSGGPLICDGVIQGIVSWGISCAHYKYPGVYTRVGKYIRWIKNKIRRF
ncbi:trypsin I-P1-like [Carcharodon carcharias]|uniref:trypsin I-P1-like n=1 Tax=Carcharodon carcharias TaxID=13397 RepID=UPI001B7E6A1E|nr:trypsin I-P1-like [Carcharodon carcharias]